MTLRHCASGLVAIALVWSLWSGWRIWTTPVRYQTINWHADATGRMVGEEGFEFRSFRQISVFGVAPLVVPVLLTAIAAWAAWLGSGVVVATCALLFMLFAFISGFSIGGAYVLPSGLMVLGMLASLVDQARSK